MTIWAESNNSIPADLFAGFVGATPGRQKNAIDLLTRDQARFG
jgi:hypothetical protein